MRKLSDLVKEGMQMTHEAQDKDYAYLDSSGHACACVLGAADIALKDDVFAPYIDAIEDSNESSLTQYISQEEILRSLQDVTGFKLLQDRKDQFESIKVTRKFSNIIYLNDTKGRDKALAYIIENE